MQKYYVKYDETRIGFMFSFLEESERTGTLIECFLPSIYVPESLASDRRLEASFKV